MRSFELGTLSLIVYCLSVPLLPGRCVGTRRARHVEKDDGLYASPDRHVLLSLCKSRYIGVGASWRLYMAAVLILRTPAHIMATEGDNGCVQQACLVGYALCVYVPESLPSGHLAETGDVYCKLWLGCMMLAIWQETAWFRKCGSARLCLSCVWLSEVIGLSRRVDARCCRFIQGLRRRVPLFLPVALYTRRCSFQPLSSNFTTSHDSKQHRLALSLVVARRKECSEPPRTLVSGVGHGIHQTAKETLKSRKQG
jgi:hypothetical protein